MKKALLFFSLLFFVSAVSAQQIPTCNIGSTLAVDLNRKLAPGEEITTQTGGIVVISQREAPGSTSIGFRRCVLPTGEEVVIGGTIPWVKKCGNALLQTEGWSLPLATSQKPTLALASKPERPLVEQKPLVVEKQGDTNVYVYVQQDVHITQDSVPPPPPPPAMIPPKKSRKKLVAVLVGAGTAAGVVAAILLREGSHKDPVTIIRTGP